MELIGLIFIGLVAFVATLLSVITNNDEVAIIAGLIGTVSWLLFAFFALDVTHYDSNGNPLTTRYPALAIWGVAMAVPNFYVAMTGPLHIISDKNPRQNEVR